MNELAAYGGVALMVILTGIGSSISVTIAGNATIGFTKKNPDVLGQHTGFSTLPSSQGPYDLVGFSMVNGLIKDLFIAGVFSAGAVWAIFATELSLSLVNLYLTICQVRVCASGIEGIGADSDLFGATMVMAVLPELYAILALLISILTFDVVRGLFLAA